MAALAASLLKPDFNASGPSQFSDGLNELICDNSVVYRTIMSYVNVVASNPLGIKRVVSAHKINDPTFGGAPVWATPRELHSAHVWIISLKLWLA